MKNLISYLAYSSLLISTQLFAAPFHEKIRYNFTVEPIDVVIPAVEKDLLTLDSAIYAIRKYGIGVRNIYVISHKKLTDEAAFFNEQNYPFDKQSIAQEIIQDPVKREKYLKQSGNRIGWIYQQLLKFYAPYVLPGISSNILVLDSDTIFLKSTRFINYKGEPLLNPGTEYHPPYFQHASKLINGFRRMQNLSGISHHMLIQRPVLDHLFTIVENQHQTEFWKAFCRCIDGDKLVAGELNSACSEFEIYFNFILSTSNQAHVRHLKWANVVQYRNSFDDYRAKGYDYVSNHAYLRDRN